jgi:hypothetical protein
MDIVGWLTLVLVIMTLISVNGKKAAPPPKSIEAPPVKTVIVNGALGEHVLKRTWIGEGHHAVKGWRWQCTCGTIGVAGNADRDKSLGSEDNAINRFKAHAQGFREANKDIMQERYNLLQKEFDDYISKCYCKDSNNDLIVLLADRKKRGT